ncbi:hypothetical protein [Catenibacterium mitsuokai]|uniref:hypothetical protein n=1 Tax=Catenibacterium mitsuokai TaxID=100886 RepID=UPI0029249686|nr:hypothetical protein AUSP0005_00012 [uncultured phage]
MIIKEFENGNFHIKYENDDVIPTSLDSCLVDMMLNLDMSDMYMISETWESLSNFNAGATFYNIRLDKMYIVSDIEIAALRAEKSITLEAFGLDSYNRELINNWLNKE